MGFLQQTWLQVQEHLRGLTVSQRLAIALCVGLIAVSLAWLMHVSVTPDMVALLDQSFTPQELVNAQRELDRSGIRYSIKGDRVYVPSEQRDWLLARLQESEALPSDMTISFAKLMEEQSIWVSYEDAAWQRQVALGNELARVLKRFSGVRNAQVFIDRPVKKGFGNNQGEPKASVYLETRANARIDRGFVDAVASFVSGAVIGLRPENVSIVDATTGQRYEVRSRDNAMAADLLDDRRKKEEHYAEKIRSQLSYIHGVLVGVFAEVETEARRTEARTLGQPMVTEEESTSDSQRTASPGSEPGVMPNAAVSVPGGGGGGMTREQTTDRTRFAKGDETITVSENMRGVIKRLTASINVPRSYFIRIYQQRTGQDQAPTDDDLQPIIDEHLPLIKAQVKPLVDATTDEQVQVSWFYDVPIQAEVALASTGNFGEALGQYVRPAGLAGLAVLSLGMMIMLVRKAQPPRPIGVRIGGSGGSGDDGGSGSGGGTTSGGRKAVEELLTIEGGPVGKAQVTQPILEGREVDEDTLKSQQIIEQVNSLVKDDPDAVASMLRKWIEESH